MVVVVVVEVVEVVEVVVVVVVVMVVVVVGSSHSKCGYLIFSAAYTITALSLTDIVTQ